MRFAMLPPARKPPGSLRIIGGSLRGSKLAVADLPGLRPTPDRARETLFNWLAPFVDGARTLDLFAGTGALGIEALSRGAASCVFVERDRDLAARIAANLERLHVAERARVVPADAAAFLDGAAQAFDLVFLDPPYAAGLWAAVAGRLEHGGWLAPAALVCVETPRGAAPVLPATWTPHRAGDAGAVHHVLYRRAQPDPLS
jgi:16S rRNA (guanine966-N2)-methyltransferase